ncbi:transposon Ty3-G Gag-Pol polyprotein [Elysia marginata]|uniref:Transposon Ty3-G Gag-Pol polyprotein n=1 Tax=Elysia marginata TaxID=1093978 RepID=A0AAV4IRJ0_9GAST|nr:transposon Ty3-G Gag-Pol polyprotein [Elysia marginata]
MTKFLRDQDGAVCIYAPCQSKYCRQVPEHDTMDCLQDAGLTANDKMLYNHSKTLLKLHGDTINATGTRVDPYNVRAIADFFHLRVVQNNLRFLGMVNQLRKFAPGLAAMKDSLL